MNDIARNAVTVNKKYIEYFIPTVLTAMANNIAMIVDSVIAGNLIGGNALAAINLLSPVSQLYFALTVLFGLGASTVISIAKGRRDGEYADKVYTVSLFTVLAVSFILVAVQLPLSGKICGLLTSDPELFSLLHKYYIPFIIGTPLNLLLLCASHIIRTDGRPTFASNIIIIANVVNLVMDFVYMGVFKMGIAGSSIATVTGYAVGFVIMIFHFIKHRNTVHINMSVFKEKKQFCGVFSNLFSTGLSGALGTLLITVKLQFLNTLIQRVGGSAAMVSYSLCSSSNIFVSMFITGASQTMIPIIGVCLGEKDYDGVKYAFKRAFKILAYASLIVTAVICIAPEPIIMFFGVNTPAEIADAVPAMRINALSFPFQAFSFLFLYYFMATEKKAISTTISVVNSIVIQIPASLILAAIFGINGVWISLVAAQAGTLIVIYFITVYKKRKSGGVYKDFYLIKSGDDNEIISISFKGTKKNAVDVSEYIANFLTKHGIDRSVANKTAIAVEEIAVSIDEKNNKKADIDIRICIENGKTVIALRDNGVAFNPSESDNETAEVISGTDLVRIISDNIKYSRALGFNSTIITI